MSAAGLELSIVIVNWNRAALTERCLAAVGEHTLGPSFEILVVDNGSAPEELALLAEACRRHEARLIGLNQNLYFGEANNIGVEAARGERILFLNNDAFVSAGYAPPLIATLDQAYAAGAVGPRFRFPDGRLQEAGAYVRPDGWTLQHGKGADPVDAISGPGRHIVDYCSAACLMVRRDLFLSMGGFDPLYDPAYFEDVDLMFRMRARGLYTYLCGDVEVVHEENVTSRKVWDEERRTRVVTAGHDRFFARWGDYLADRLFKAVARPAFPIIDWRPAPSARPAGETLVLRGPGLIADQPDWIALIRQAGAASLAGHVVFEADEACSRMRLYTLAARAGVTLGSFEVRRAKA